MVATSLTGVDKVGRPTLSDLLQAGVISFFDWGYVNAGSYQNVSVPTSGVYGGNKHVLRPVKSKYKAD